MRAYDKKYEHLQNNVEQKIINFIEDEKTLQSDLEKIAEIIENAEKEILKVMKGEQYVA